MAETYSAGIVTAYGAAVRGGYTGTYEQWCQDMANLGDNVAEVRTKAAQAAQSAENAAGSATAAAGSAGSAAGSASEAASSAGNAAGSATAAAESATAAAGSASNAASSATAASASATAAGNAQAAAETAQGKAEDAQEAAEQAQSDAEAAAQSVSQSAAQISQNTSDIGDLKSAVNDPVTGLNSKAPVIIDTASGSIASFPDGADGLPLHKLTVNIEPVQEGSGDPSPENVRPISGWTGANVTRTGKNLYDISTYPMTADKGIVASNGSLTADSRVKASAFWPCHDFIGKSLTLNCRLGGISTLGVCFYNERKVYISGFTDISVTPLTAPNTFTVPSGAYYLRFTALAAQTGIQIELGNEATTFEAYAGATYPISWQSEAGTVYGGTLDVTSGVLTVDMAMVVFNGTQAVGVDNWRANASSVAWLYPFSITPGIKIIDSGTALPSIISDVFKTVQYGGSKGVYDGTFDCISVVTGGAEWGIAMRSTDLSLTTQSAINEWLTQNPVTVVYELTNPTTYQLTPQEIDTLLGTNNIWADCGDVEAEYRADTKLYIQKINAPADDDMTADAQIASGKYFIVGDNLYLSTTTIPAGDTIIPGTNCTKTDLAAALNALNT